ncbi:hypothetical protein M409DRAFT_24865 [Zasmidium cellare ATCC 36951]|uniref:Uncharacterized protein n=1 Tax=Zasmidium cellare ATCC 36951 TaxID=1080233 RepID=A0A6A6CCQ3_ZASCE|nr:uncharacterized protein M409DRAFT_24865 [Zasmidium cellare ATCC 36951]KAF2164964.1 hypothetical protein M409DRAFT_24865 [Zasmidium cellare ATCC 36951]
MASYHYAMPQYHSNTSSHSNHSHGHHGRSRRGPRVASQNAHRQYKQQRSPKEETPQPPTHGDYLRVLEAAKSFEFDDDEVFCPFNLLTEDDLQSIHSSSSSDRGSLSSGSPEGSPLQQQVQPTPSLLLSSVPNTYSSAGYQQAQQQMKLHQPLAQRTRNAIPIVDPSTRSVASPAPMSVSPGRQMQQQYVPRRW